jgi:hypothetical protein
MTDNHELQKTVNQLAQYIENAEKYGGRGSNAIGDLDVIKNIHGWLTELKNIRSTEL